MQEGKKTITHRRTLPRNPLETRSRRVSGIVGAALAGLALLWLVWLVIRQLTGGSILSTLPLPGLTQPTPTVGQIAPLSAAGISLGTPSQPPALTQAQALLIAGQLEPDAATKAGKTSAQYVLLNYAGTGTAVAQHAFTNVPAWIVLYQQIPLQPADPSADPSQSLQTHHDLYVFLDANTGKELLAIWV